MSGLNQFTNNASTTLASGVSIGATSLTVASGTGMLFPTLAGSQYFYCTLANLSATALEIVKVTARSGDVFTIVRGQDNTTDQAWSAGDKVELRLTAADLQNFPQLDSTNTFAQAQTFTANPVMSGLTASKAVFTDASKNLSSTGTLGADQGGTGKATLTANNVLLGNGTSAVQEVAPGANGNVLTSNGTTWTSAAPASGARSGASYATLSSGTPNITLTSSSDQVQVITATESGQSITLPDMTTVSKGAGYFVFYNTSNFAVALKDAGGTVREYLLPQQTNSLGEYKPSQACILVIEDTSTSNGVWHVQNPTISLSTNQTSFTATNTTGSSTYYPTTVVQVAPTYFLFFAGDGTTTRACLGTLNTSTKTFTFGSYTTLFTVSSNEGISSASVDSNGVDKGIYVIGTSRNVSSTGARFNAYGFAIVAGTLYWSTAANYYTGVTIASYGGTGLNAVCSYAGSNDAFIVIGYSGVSNQVSYGIKIMGYTVTVAGTTVTLTGSAANYSASNSSQLQYSIGFTTKTTLVAETTTASVVAYINYVPSTNTITSGARTSQLTRISGVLCPNVIYDSYQFNISSSYLFTTSGSKAFSGLYAWTYTNAGSATVTVSTTTYSIKSTSAKSYSTLSTGVIVSYVYSVSGSSAYVYDSTNKIWYSCDPSNSSVNFNSTLLNLPNLTYSGTSYTQALKMTSSTQVINWVMDTAPTIPIIYVELSTISSPFIS